MAVTIDSELAALDRRMTSLRIDYERFFAGDLKQAPLVARRELEQFLKRLGNSGFAVAGQARADASPVGGQ